MRAPYAQYLGDMVSDGVGGAIIAWEDGRNGSDMNIFAQGVNGAGFTRWWPCNGVAICMASNDQSSPRLVSDGGAGAILTWRDRRNGDNYDLYAQRVGACGVTMWSVNGVAVCTASGDQMSPAIAWRGDGAVIGWEDYRDVSRTGIYVQAISVSGELQWQTDGVAACTASDGRYSPRVASDHAGGSFVVWSDLRNSNSDIYAQHVNYLGSPTWMTDGVPICTAPDDQAAPRMIDDREGSAIVAWEDHRWGQSDIYAQRIDGSGVCQWTDQGVDVSTVAQDQVLPSIINDGNVGAIIAWRDFRRSAGGNIYAQWVGDEVPVPIQLATFTAQQVDSATVLLQWTTLSEVSNYGFEVQKSRTRQNGFSTITGSFIPGHGTTLEPRSYSYADRAAGLGVWYYRLRQIDLDGTISYSEAVHVDLFTDVKKGETPTEFSLSQNFPNPFNSTTKIRFSIANPRPPYGVQEDGQAQFAILKVFDVLGREVLTLVNEAKQPGTYTVEFDGSNLSGGIYFYRLSVSPLVRRGLVPTIGRDGQAGEFVQVRKLLLLK